MKIRIMISASLSLLCLFNFSREVYGQNLHDYLIIASENNPGLKAIFNQYQASLERVPQVGALPDPQLSFGIFISPMERYTGNQVAGINLMQMFPWFGTLDAAKIEAALMAKAKFENFNEARSMLHYEVKANWYSSYLLEKRISITEENLKILHTLEDLAINRYKSGSSSSGSTERGGQSSNRGMNKQSSGPSGGKGGMQMQSASPAKSSMPAGMSVSSGMGEMGSNGSLVDVLRVQMEINELKDRLALLRDDVKPQTAQFNKLLNRPSAQQVIFPDTIESSLPVSVAQIPDSIRDNNPMLRMLEREEEAFEAQKRMNRKMGFPMIGLGLQYDIFQPRMGGESMMNGNDMLMPMATLSIPLWRKKYNASVKEADFLRQSAINQRRDLDNQLMVSYEEALRDYRDAQRRIELYKRQIVLAQQARDILIVQYTTSGTDFEEVMRIQQQLLDYQIRDLEAIVDQAVSVAMLERLMGR